MHRSRQRYSISHCVARIIIVVSLAVLPHAELLIARLMERVHIQSASLCDGSLRAIEKELPSWLVVRFNQSCPLFASVILEIGLSIHSVAVVNFRLLQPMVHTTTLVSEHRLELPNTLDRYSPDTPRKSLAFLRSSA